MIAVIMFAGILLSCGENNTSGGEIVTDETENLQIHNISEPEQEIGRIEYEIPEDSNFDGHIFRVVHREGDIYWVSIDIYAEAETGEPVNDAVYKRNRIVEDKLNISIQEIRRDLGDVIPFVQRSVNSGSDDFDFVHSDLQRLASLVQRGQIVNLYNVPYLDFSKP